MTTWRKELTQAFRTTKDSFDNIVITITHEQLDIEGRKEYGGGYGAPVFMAWSDLYVYYSDDYDGLWCVAWVRRHPVESAKPIVSPAPHVKTIGDLAEKFK